MLAYHTYSTTAREQSAELNVNSDGKTYRLRLNTRNDELIIGLDAVTMDEIRVLLEQELQAIEHAKHSHDPIKMGM